MKKSSTFVSDSGALSAALDAARGPVVVLDPCGELWSQYWQKCHWDRMWAAWRFMPGDPSGPDSWDVLGELRDVDNAAGAAALAVALFPANQYTEATRQVMVSVLAFANDTRHFSGLPELAGQLWADDLWTAIARWSRQYMHHPALQAARTLLTQEGANEAEGAIRSRMATYHHPHVAQTFQSGAGFRLSTLAQQPCQVIFLTPSIRCMENPELTAVYALLLNSLRRLGALYSVEFALIEPTLNAEGDVT